MRMQRIEMREQDLPMMCSRETSNLRLVSIWRKTVEGAWFSSGGYRATDTHQGKGQWAIGVVLDKQLGDER